MKSIDPDGRVREWEVFAEWPADNGGTYQVSRPKDQDQDEPATPPSTQTRSIGWGGGRLTARDMRAWLDQIPNQAFVDVYSSADHGEYRYSIIATWEVDS